ncbi:MAG: ArsR family transcriptional regulator [Metallosphaera sp.]
MNLSQVKILTLLLEGELSLSEIAEYLGLSKEKVKRETNRLLKSELIEMKAVIGDEPIFSITRAGIDKLIVQYYLLKSIIREMEEIICSTFECS